MITVQRIRESGLVALAACSLVSCNKQLTSSEEHALRAGKPVDVELIAKKAPALLGRQVTISGTFGGLISATHDGDNGLVESESKVSFLLRSSDGMTPITVSTVIPLSSQESVEDFSPAWRLLGVQPGERQPVSLVVTGRVINEAGEVRVDFK